MAYRAFSRHSKMTRKMARPVSFLLVVMCCAQTPPPPPPHRPQIVIVCDANKGWREERGGRNHPH